MVCCDLVSRKSTRVLPNIPTASPWLARQRTMIKILSSVSKIIRSTTKPRSTQTGSGLHLANQTDNQETEDLTFKCAYCGRTVPTKYEQQFSIHRDGFGEGPQVPLCAECVGNEDITLGVIWAKIAHPEPLIEAIKEVTNGTV